MKGMKKRGKGMNKAKKKSKKCLAFLLVLLFVIGTTVAPAAVAEGDGGAIEEINEKLDAIDDDSTINTFLYNRMLEYDNPEFKRNEGIKAVKIVVMNGHWWSGHKEVKTFYIVRNDKDEQIDIKGKYRGNDKDLWTFNLTIKQTINALDMIISCSEDCMTYKKAVHSLIRLGILAVVVDKSDNVPDITEIITKSPWASSYLPNWAKEFLERFERLH